MFRARSPGRLTAYRIIPSDPRQPSSSILPLRSSNLPLPFSVPLADEFGGFTVRSGVLTSGGFEANFTLGTGSYGLVFTDNGQLFVTFAPGGMFFNLQSDRPPTYSPVPGPVVGAGLPGLILAGGVLLLLARRRRRTV